MLNLMKRQIAKKYQSFERNLKQEGLTHSEQITIRLSGRA